MKDIDQEIIKFNYDGNFKEDDFYVSKSNKQIFDLLNKWPKWEKNFLNISGEKFSGKTHLINIFLKKYNEKITSKDLRTWNANNLLIEYMKLTEIKTAKNPVKKAIEKVAEKLHNTYHICMKSYINPILIEKLKNK